MLNLSGEEYSQGAQAAGVFSGAQISEEYIDRIKKSIVQLD